MNITPLDIYLVSIVDNIRIATFVITVLSTLVVVIFIGLTIGINSDNEKLSEKDKRFAHNISIYLKKSLTVMVLSTALLVFTPSSRALAAMYVIPAMANSELVSKDIPEAGKALIEMATEWMRTQTKSIKEAKK